MKKVLSALAGALLLAALVAPAAAQAAPKYNPDIWVSHYGTPSAGNGTSCRYPDFENIEDAISHGGTHVGDVIHICPGTYYEWNLGSDHATITLEGEGPSKTIIDMNGNGRFISTYEEDCCDEWWNDIVLRGMTIQHGETDWHGGAVAAGNVTCTNVDFKYNAAWDGYSGGAVVAFGSYTGNRCRYIENYATDDGGAVWAGFNFTSTNETYIGNHAEDWGGAIFHTGWDEGQASVVNGKFMGYYYAYHHSGDDADYGGAIFNNDGNLSVTKSTFQSLSTDYRGGAIYTHADNVIRLTNNKFLYNDADGDGGAYFQWESTATEYFVGNEFTGNYSDDDGGAIYTSSYDSYFRSNKFAYNEAWDDGDAVLFQNWCGGGPWTTIDGKVYGLGTTPSTGNNKYTYVTEVWPWYYDSNLVDSYGC